MLICGHVGRRMSVGRRSAVLVAQERRKDGGLSRSRGLLRAGGEACCVSMGVDACILSYD